MVRVPLVSAPGFLPLYIYSIESMFLWVCVLSANLVVLPNIAGLVHMLSNIYVYVLHKWLAPPIWHSSNPPDPHWFPFPGFSGVFRIRSEVRSPAGEALGP